MKVISQHLALWQHADLLLQLPKLGPPLEKARQRLLQILRSAAAAAAAAAAAKGPQAAEALGCIRRSLQQLVDSMEAEGISVLPIQEALEKYNSQPTEN
ncbi:hypothetical protein ETH_00000610 [Eimeria tenella]|uniref:Uncharacterized protein n=1 Tax=Eimeria tenella TaxID=5802 RepID=U6L1F4_EIMTE|nr:hypothetical protein ETH_00000610 [Eimeria tenella]CDJ44247.1 hypothetical protein ETH_00000610 [Eimeria tenella]|eukprot:XP_013234996.1 hypothetical protein ETH_00000610 [Eimeria tenella]